MPDKPNGKLRTHEQLTMRLLTWMPVILTGLLTVPLPVLFLVLFLTSASTDLAAFYLLLSGISLAIGLVIAVLIMISFWLYRRRRLRLVKNRLAADGITAAELTWFYSDLSSEERKTWRELKDINALLGDAYGETLAMRLTATRMETKARTEVLRIERQINRTRRLAHADTTSLLEELSSDREELEVIRKTARRREAEAKARLQTIDAAARREISQVETRAMLQRLAAAQSHIPLGLEIAKLEQEARKETVSYHTPPPTDPN